MKAKLGLLFLGSVLAGSMAVSAYQLTPPECEMACAQARAQCMAQTGNEPSCTAWFRLCMEGCGGLN